jgi:hypothetical protein
MRGDIQPFGWQAALNNFERDVIFLRSRELPSGRGERAVAKFEIVDDTFDRDFEPTLTLPRIEAQQLFDALWSIGFRPKNGEDSEAQRSAMRETMKVMDEHREQVSEAYRSHIRGLEKSEGLLHEIVRMRFLAD